MIKRKNIFSVLLFAIFFLGVFFVGINNIIAAEIMNRDACIRLGGTGEYDVNTGKCLNGLGGDATVTKRETTDDSRVQTADNEELNLGGGYSSNTPALDRGDTTVDDDGFDYEAETYNLGDQKKTLPIPKSRAEYDELTARCEGGDVAACTASGEYVANNTPTCESGYVIDPHDPMSCCDNSSSCLFYNCCDKSTNSVDNPNVNPLDQASSVNSEMDYPILSNGNCGDYSNFTKIGGVCFPANTGLADPSGGLAEILSNVLSWLLGIFTTIAIIAFVISGIMYLTSAGDTDQIEKAKNNAKFAILGVIVGLSGFIVLKAIQLALSGSKIF